MLTDLGRDRADDIARVERRDHIHDGNAGNALAVQDRPVDGRGAAILRQKRGVNVDAAVLRQVQDLLRQDLSVGRDHDQLGRKLPQYAECFPVAHFERLIDRQVLC